ncbi:enoyl-CoA hydratase-related protein [Sphingomonas lycopersici]|uniref:Enoyl-CoA hydratase-related protein n=1 Tax=Sphingomonas lycopersici TaxID=2951807 RepID=A0AA42CV29_9SPHN|nr:enoyl-CoA hydratase-related protein [Sphingomonas lycopersici]MCW6536073.1 enoyl-CoA hydratase-related protein [Sphingomonas lycopersici]
MTTILLQRRGHVAEVRLNRPEVLNAIDDEMDAALADAWAHIDNDPEIRIAVLTAAGDRAFCAGGDMAAPPTGRNGLSFGGGLTGIGGRLRQLRKPLICGVHGHVLGLGFELAMCADIIVAADNASFRLPEARAGVIDHCGVVHRAIRQLPHHVAMAMIVAAAPLDALRAAQYGLVNECVPGPTLSIAIDRWIERLLACSPLVSQAAKYAALDGLDTNLADALRGVYPPIEAYKQSNDSREALAAWRDRRPPQWQGR